MQKSKRDRVSRGKEIPVPSFRNRTQHLLKSSPSTLHNFTDTPNLHLSPAVGSYSLFGLAILLWGPSFANACEPVPALLEVVQGGLPLTKSIAITCVIVFLKMLLFAYLQNAVPRIRALMLMFCGNLVSWILGVLISLLIGAASSFLLLGALLTWPLFLLPARRMKKLPFFILFHRFSAKRLATYMTIGFATSGLLFLVAELSLQDHEYFQYWGLKLIAIYLALSISIVFSALWEEIVIWKISKQPSDFQGFFEPVLKANLAILFLLMLYAGILTLPERSANQYFIANNDLGFGLVK